MSSKFSQFKHKLQTPPPVCKKAPDRPSGQPTGGWFIQGPWELVPNAGYICTITFFGSDPSNEPGYVLNWSILSTIVTPNAGECRNREVQSQALIHVGPSAFAHTSFRIFDPAGAYLATWRLLLPQ